MQLGGISWKLQNDELRPSFSESQMRGLTPASRRERIRYDCSAERGVRVSTLSLDARSKLLSMRRADLSQISYIDVMSLSGSPLTGVLNVSLICDDDSAVNWPVQVSADVVLPRVKARRLQGNIALNSDQMAGHMAMPISEHENRPEDERS